MLQSVLYETLVLILFSMETFVCVFFLQIIKLYYIPQIIFCAYFTASFYVHQMIQLQISINLNLILIPDLNAVKFFFETEIFHYRNVVLQMFL